MTFLANWKKDLSNSLLAIFFLLFIQLIFIHPVTAGGQQGPLVKIAAPEPYSVIRSQSLYTEIEITCKFKNIKRLLVNGTDVLLSYGNKVKSSLPVEGFGRKDIRAVAITDKGSVVTDTIPIIIMRSFPDIKDHWAGKEIEYLATLGIMKGKMGSGFFLPESALSRAELAVILVEANQLPLITEPVKDVADVPANYWAAPYIYTAVAEGLLAVDRLGNFAPDSLVTRTDAIVAVNRAFKIPLYSAGKKFLPDVPEAFWARDALYTSMINGMLPDKWDLSKGLKPNYIISRAEFAALLARSPVIREQINALTMSEVELPFATLDLGPADKLPLSTQSKGRIKISKPELKANGYISAKLTINTNLFSFAGKVKKIEADLTSVGKLANTAMLDDGLWEDTYAHDGVFTVALVPSPGIFAGTKEIPIQIVDKYGNTYEEHAYVEIKESSQSESFYKLAGAVTGIEPVPAVKQPARNEEAVSVNEAYQAETASKPTEDKKEVVYIIKRGDTLLTVSKKTTGTPYKWKEIAEYNNVRIEEREIDGKTYYHSYIEVGQKLIIPPGLLP